MQTAIAAAPSRAQFTIRDARSIAGVLGYPSKMPGTSYGLSAHKCLIGSKLAKIPGSVCHGCYALKGNYLYPSIAASHRKRFKSLRDPRWTAAMVAMLLHMHSRDKKGRARKGRNGRIVPGWHRWHDSGDLQSVEHLTKICAVAALTPAIRHWLPTREFAIVKQYLAQGGIVPANLVIRVSATMIDGPATSQWPTTSGVHKDAPPRGHTCPASKQNGKCGKCRACWSPEIAHVSYPKH
jgi:hypothetical protein